MQSRLVHEANGQRTFVVVLETGDEVRNSLHRLAEDEGLSGAQLSAIGALRCATIRWFDWEAKQYRPIPVEEQVEVVSLLGDIALDTEGQPKLHLHAVLGRRDGSAMGGDLERGEVRPTLEIVVTESPTHLQRVHDPQTGLALIRLDGQVP
ncbi:PPC domain-containing DNA-binding protein [Falsiroseomonas sp. HW251]|uniref:PPC domain-containing DNA-binding protein n=1 Tax=Falsiroseomonas sp. HW251 TaxID=3390998 RepID=UPI003D31BC13